MGLIISYNWYERSQDRSGAEPGGQGPLVLLPETGVHWQSEGPETALKRGEFFIQEY